MTSDPFEPTSTTCEQKNSIQKLLIDWNRIQGRLKRAEQISQLAIVPAINELRYAGRMLVSALSGVAPTAENQLPSVDDAIISARQYLKNADHDISDSLIYFFQGRVDEINRRFGAKSVTKRYPQYEELLKNLEKSRKLVIQSRSNLGDRDRNYKELAEVVEKIIDDYFILDKSEVFMAIEVNNYEASIKRHRISLAVLVVVSVVLAWNSPWIRQLFY